MACGENLVCEGIVVISTLGVSVTCKVSHKVSPQGVTSTLLSHKVNPVIPSITAGSSV